MRYSRFIDEDRKKKKTIAFLFIFLLLSIGIIVGLSYILFNKDGDDGKIGINVTTGRCEVDIFDKDGNSLINEVLEFVSEDGATEVLFHPGETYYTESFSIKNTGNITVDFRVNISEDESVDMEVFRKAFDVWIATDVSDLENAERITSFSGKLKVGETSEHFYLVVHMKESAGNEFQDKSYSGIGITVHVVESGA